MRISAVLHTIPVVVVSALTPAAAGDECGVLQGYYRVMNMDGSDHTGMRLVAGTKALLLQTFTDGQIVFSDGSRGLVDNVTWQKVNVMQTGGWVEARNLRPARPQSLPDTDIPVAGSCNGFDPPWRVVWSRSQLRLTVFPDHRDLTVQSAVPSHAPSTSVLTAKSGDTSVKLIYSGKVCANHGGNVDSWGSAYLFVQRQGQEQVYGGCCQTAADAFAMK